MSTVDVSEKSFESLIEAALLGATSTVASTEPAVNREGDGAYLATPGVYRKRFPTDYDRPLCLIPADTVDFVQVTQPMDWDKLKQQLGGNLKRHFLRRIAHEVEQRGTLDVLRQGIKLNGCRFQLAYFRPASGLNPETQKLYAANLFSIVRQLKYSGKNESSLDLVLFLNGLPLFTAELKNPLTGHGVEDAMRQYETTRDSREPLFGLGRCLAHFAVDPDLVFMTTHLAGPKTRFLPFNRGRGNGAGNPIPERGFATAYLWEQVWAGDSVLDLVQNFAQVVAEDDDDGKQTGHRLALFPRYHQLDAVRRLLAAARHDGPGQRYLIQHSAGGGKSNSIAWLAHQLMNLYDGHDQRCVDSIIVITDRPVLDRQLQTAMRQFQQILGVVENIDQTSRQLKAALEDGKNVIVTTLQKFPVIQNEISELPSHRFAVIVDEAHSSRSGESTKSLKDVLSAGSLEEAERQAGGEEDDAEDRIVAEMRARGDLPNVSYFAFTATPKAKTLELFGTRQPDGSCLPFSLYSMRQAIEEGFILDVLANYTTYQSYFSLLKKIESDPRYDRDQAMSLRRSFVDLHEHTVAKKVAIMVDHFATHTAPRIGGKARAMIVTPSRLHAVRYQHAVAKYLKEKNYPYQSLVAFTGTVHDGGIDYTEAGMNGFPETQTAEVFKHDGYRILIVANKFQTGVDQPLLHTMYLDKKLGGVNAVQTLSRLNRVHPDKAETMVLDFANQAEDIQKAFEPYFETTLRHEGTDPNLLYDLQSTLSNFHFYDDSEVDQFARTFYSPRVSQDRLHLFLAPIVERYIAASEAERLEFRAKLTDYVRLYSFLSQVITFVDTDLEKLSVFGRFLLRKLPVPRDQRSIEI